MSAKKEITVVIPAYNEEGNIEDAVHSVISAISDVVDDYEILVIDDGSVDKTAKVVSKINQSNVRVTVVSNDGNKGYGFTFRRGIALAKKDYISFFPGDNDMSGESFKRIIENMLKADVVTSHMTNMQKRAFLRRCLSRTFVCIMNFLFSLRLKYYTGMFVCRTKMLRSISLVSDGLPILAECMVRLIRLGHSYQSIGFEHTGRRYGQSKALDLRAVISVLHLIVTLLRDIYFTKEYQKKKYVLHSS